MKRITMKNTIGLLIVVMALSYASSASAYVAGVWDPQPRVQNNDSSWTTSLSLTSPTDYQSTYFTTTATVNPTANTYTSTNKSTNTSTTKNTNTSNTKTTTNNSNTNNTNNVSNLPPVVTTTDSQAQLSPLSLQGATALSVRGSGSFMPSSIFQWILVIILIIAIIIIARMIAKPVDDHAGHGAPAH